MSCAKNEELPNTDTIDGKPRNLRQVWPKLAEKDIASAETFYLAVESNVTDGQPHSTRPPSTCSKAT